MRVHFPLSSLLCANAGQVVVWLMLVSLVSGVGGTAQGEGDPPNVIMILVDDMGWDIAALGHPHVKTPNLDRLVSEGRVFENFYVASPVCSPTRVSFMTGHQPSRFGIHDFISSNLRVNMRRNMPNYLDADVVLVTDVAKRAGYRTGHFGKWHLSRGSNAPRLTDYGIDEFRTSWPINNHYWSYSSHYFVDAAIGFLDANGDQPFYLNLWFFQMHDPLVASSAQKRVYDGEAFPVEDFDSYMRDYSVSMPDAHERFLEYNAVMTSVDGAVGRLLDYLEQAGLAENTLLLFTSDNGPEDYRLNLSSSLGCGNTGRFRGRKRSIYEGGVRMPCIARWPGVIPAGTVDTTSVICSSDWLPSIATLLGEFVPPFLDGEDRLEVLKGTPSARATPIVWEYRSDAVGPLSNAPQFAIRDGRWKLLWEEGLAEPELYDLVDDPEERHNVAALESAVVATLRQKIEDFQGELAPRVPEIHSQPPANETSDPGDSVSWMVEASGSPPPAFQWYRNGFALENRSGLQGASSPLLTIENVGLSDTGDYVCEVKNSAGTVESSVQLTVELAPTVTRHPVPVFLWDGGVASYSVSVIASEPISYQWLRNGVALSDGGGIEGSRTANLLIGGLPAPLSLSGSAGYRCQVWNPVGAILSEGAGVTVIAPGAPTFETWHVFHLGGPVGSGTYEEDSDGDGWNNFHEFAGVTNPNDDRSKPYFDVVWVGDALEVHYNRWRGGVETGFGSYETPELRYELEILEATNWESSLELLSLVRTEPTIETTGERVVYRALLPFSRPSLILRLKVSQR
jgi:N-acetylgalactosamine-6-sulfatase